MRARDIDPSRSELPPLGALVPQDRRYATVLFVDIVGSTKIITAKLEPEFANTPLDAVEAASARLLPIVTAAERAIRRYGTTLKNLGDGWMAVFGLSSTEQEDHAIRACHAALAILSDLRSINKPTKLVRIGVNSG